MRLQQGSNTQKSSQNRILLELLNEQTSRDQETIQVKNKIINQILDQKEIPKDKESIRVKNDILLILLLISGYGVYYIAGVFINIIIIGLISGIVYYQFRKRFIIFVTSYSKYNKIENQQTITIRLLQGVCFLIAIFNFSYLRNLLKYPDQFYQSSLENQMELNHQDSGLTLSFAHISLLALMIYYIIGKNNIVGLLYKFKLNQYTHRSFIKLTFLVIIVLLFLFVLIVVPIFVYREIISTGNFLRQKIQESFECSLTGKNSNDLVIPLCTQKLAGLSVLKRMIEQSQNQNQTISICTQKLVQLQQTNLGTRVIPYEQYFCIIYSWLQKLSPYINKDFMLSTSTNVFFLLFGSLSSFLILTSNLAFNFSIFTTNFQLALDPENIFSFKSILQRIFIQQRSQIIRQITQLFRAILLIGIYHFLLSFLILELLGFSSINMVLSIILSLMAFIPFFRPWFGMLLFVLLRFLIVNIKQLLSLELLISNFQLYIAIVMVVLYWYLSQKIYSYNLVKLSLDPKIINMSVLFGIYQFGGIGVIYGPLIIIILKFIKQSLLKNRNIQVNQPLPTIQEVQQDQ